MKIRVLFLAMAFAVSAANVVGQKRPKPAPPPAAACRISTIGFD